MRNRKIWKSSKYTYKRGKLAASRDSKEVSISSRLITDLIADQYDRNLRNHAKGRLLDLGCGKVPLYEAYKDYVTENICIDWMGTLHKNEYLDYELDITENLPFRENEFDTIILSDVLEHIPVPEQLWKEMARILSTNGKIILNVPFMYWLHEQPHDYYRYTEFALRRFVDRAGLRLIMLKPVGGAPEVLADIVAKSVMRVPKLGSALAIVVQSFALGFVRTKLGKQISEGTSGYFPIGYFLIAEKPN
jgi:SAM-dependent methyltransferase